MRKVLAGIWVGIAFLFAGQLSAQIVDVTTEAEFNSAITQYNALFSASDRLTIRLQADIVLSAPLTAISNGSLSRPDLVITSDNDSLRTINGNNAHQILNITGFSDVDIVRIRFINGRDTVGEGRGGAIFIDDSALVSIFQSEFENNSAPGEASAMFADSGGAIDHKGTSLFVSESTFTGNSAPSSGGAISTNPGSSLTVLVSTFVANQVTSGGFGGAVEICSFCQGEITQSTFSGNTVMPNAMPVPNGLSNDGGTTTIRSNIFADGCSSTVAGTLTNDGFNVFASSSTSQACGAVNGENNDILGQDPQLDALADNGGATRTMAIPSTSPAIDNGAVDFVNRVDQRLVSRDSLPPDSGAYEFVVADQFDSEARNDAIEMATELENGTFSDLSIDDIGQPVDSDFYRFELSVGQEFRASVLFSDVQADLDLFLLDADQNVVSFSNSVSDNEEIVFTPAESGEFFLRLFPFANDPGTLFYDMVISGIGTPDDEICVPVQTKAGGVAVICL